MLFPFYTAQQHMTEGGWFCTRSLVEQVATTGMPCSGRIHIGVLNKAQKFLLVTTDNKHNIIQFDFINDYRDDEDFFAQDWTKTCLNTMVNWEFEKLDSQLHIGDQLELDIWPKLFEQPGDKIHQSCFVDTVKLLFRHYLRQGLPKPTLIARESTTSVMTGDVDEFLDDVTDRCYTLVERLRASGKTKGVRKITGTRFKLVARGFVVEVSYETTSPTHPRGVKQIFLME
jgi:hypothetical protein